MRCMFYLSGFYGDISTWERQSVSSDDEMFFESEIAKKLGTESPSFDQVKSHFLSFKLEADLQCALPRQNQILKVRL